MQKPSYIYKSTNNITLKKPSDKPITGIVIANSGKPYLEEKLQSNLCLPPAFLVYQQLTLFMYTLDLHDCSRIRYVNIVNYKIIEHFYYIYEE